MKKLFAVLFSLTTSWAAQAEIYKQVDADGHVTYSNIPMKGSTRLNLGPAPTSNQTKDAKRPRSASMPTPAGFPKIDQNTQKQRDDKRQGILSDELASERKALDIARKNLAEGESTPEVYKGPDGKTYRNVAKFDEKMEKLREDVTLHQKNIELLEKELGGTK